MGRSTRHLDLSKLERRGADLAKLEAGLRRSPSGEAPLRWTEQLQASTKQGKVRRRRPARG